MIRKCLCFVGVILLFSSCEKPPAQNEPGPVPPGQQGGIFILNEGGFNSGNASLTFYDFKNKSMTDDVFYLANNRHLGDVLQSMVVYNEMAYLVVNNSKKIEMIDAASFQSKGTITGFNSPRYMLLIDYNKAYVSDLFDNHVAVVDMASKTITKKISCPGATEQMLMVNNKVYVTNTLQKSLYIIDPSTDQLTDSIPLSYGPNSIVIDVNKKIWVLCSGDQAGQLYAGLFRINPLNDSVELAIKNIYPAGIFGATKLCINGSKDKLYWLNTDIQSINISDTVIPSLPFIHAFKNNFYGLGVDSATGEVYASDAIDFVQRSNVNIYTPDAYMKGFFKAGINTNGFYFYYK